MGDGRKGRVNGEESIDDALMTLTDENKTKGKDETPRSQEEDLIDLVNKLALISASAELESRDSNLSGHGNNGAENGTQITPASNTQPQVNGQEKAPGRNRDPLAMLAAGAGPIAFGILIALAMLGSAFMIKRALRDNGLSGHRQAYQDLPGKFIDVK
uniref:Uncharacterized protein n=1 Tax=Branchiostoma floridae TaxID=7739 RepID=C3YVS3_BRAFL|eukprot:XP_002599595.1 hypothetical protein BRAFLDRAFT_77693 [Branchiostoma floridae]